jgi:ribonuclease P protein subunit RPR2
MTLRTDPTPILKPGISVLIQDRFALVRSCLRIVIEENPTTRVIAEAGTSIEAIEVARKLRPDIVFMDIDSSDGVTETISEMKRSVPGVRIICMTESPKEGLMDAVLAAGANGITLKTDSAAELRQVLVGVSSGRKVVTQEATAPLLDHYLDILQEKRLKDAKVIEALASAVEAKDSYTGGHAQRVATIALRIARVVDPSLEANDELRYGFILHDIGKIGVPEQILLKEAPLDADEWEMMKRHPEMGVSIISPIGFGDSVEGVVKHHHEKWDGSGYPHGLAKDEIPVGARIFSVADAYDAMTTDRPYRSRLTHEVAMAELSGRSGTQFDPEAVSAMTQLVSQEALKAS